VQGYVRNVQRLKKVVFVSFSDGSSIKPLQCVLSPEQALGGPDG
jgi:aspartyl/asparaginyl-tRNA synthetase